MSLKLVNVCINRHPNGGARINASLADTTGNMIAVHFEIEPHHNPEQLTLAEIERHAHEAAKKLHP